MQVKVTVEDENDNSPSFDRHIYQGSIRENSPPGTEVILGSVLKVQDPDINDIVTLRVSQLSMQLHRCEMQLYTDQENFIFLSVLLLVAFGQGK